ncbi:class I SAM-dependent methyltransferase [uncultured Pseudomonas sp.]|uniref:class I SAM-dependent methyltransferase n=1 Tax=uncultured Pseudomonas sp. TaxID=114707 RepID=UPI0025ECAB7B|nr:class I SAM-dependent methyltransferase [uncultured Pseudomonas sp.]
MTIANEGVKNFYDAFSDSYTDYANGTSALSELLALKETDISHAFSWGDVQTWQSIAQSLDLIIDQRRQSCDSTPISVVDIGCGDGTWALRIANHCVGRGASVNVVCLDLSPAMLESASTRFDEFLSHSEPGQVTVTYELCDLATGLAEHIKARGFDMTLCLHTVLNHLPAASLSFAIAELVAATCGFLHFSVKPPFSRPTFYAAPMSDILHFDRRNEHLYAVDRAGSFHILRSNLISHQQLEDALAPLPGRAAFIGLDVLVSRMTPDPRWVGDDPTAKLLPIEDLLSLESKTALDARYLNFANHILAIVDVRADAQSSGFD